MKKFIFALIVFIFLLLTITHKPLYAQNTNTENPPSQTDSNQSKTDAERIATLETKLNSAENYNSQILDAVYWSLGVSVAIVLLVIGLGWYTNFKIYQNDLNKIRNEIRSEMVSAARSAGESAVQSSLRDVKKLQLEMIKLEAKNYENKNYIGNAILSLSKAIRIGIELDERLYVPDLLEEMLRILRNNEYVSHSAGNSAVNEALNAVPSSYSTEVDIIRGLIRSAREKK